jgi:hypothetical protein
LAPSDDQEESLEASEDIGRSVEEHSEAEGSQDGGVVDVPVYQVAQLPRQTSDFYEAPGPVRSVLTSVVLQEGPVHIDVAIRRTASAWGLQRAKSRIRATAGAAIRSAVSARLITKRGEFLWPVDMDTPPVRRNALGEEARKVTEIAPEEIAEAAYLALKDHLVLSQEDLVRATSRIFGIGRSGSIVVDAMGSGIMALVKSGRARRGPGQMIELVE